MYNERGSHDPKDSGIGRGDREYSGTEAIAAASDSEVASTLPRLDCVGCDACNGAGGNHITFANGGRDGVKHECNAGSTCNVVHLFSTRCGGGEEHDAALGENPSTNEAVSWEALSALEGGDLVEHLKSSDGRWTLPQELGTMQWVDCFGNLVASIPLSASQLETARLVADELAQTR